MPMRCMGIRRPEGVRMSPATPFQGVFNLPRYGSPPQWVKASVFPRNNAAASRSLSLFQRIFRGKAPVELNGLYQVPKVLTARYNGNAEPHEVRGGILHVQQAKIAF